MSPIEDTRGNGWPFIFRVFIKAVFLFLLLNLLFALFDPLEALGRQSLYNRLLPGRLRLPYGEIPAESYSLSLDNIPAMLGSHIASRPKSADEFRLIIIGDSGTWGWLLENPDTLSGQLDAAGLQSSDGRRIRAYNLAYPIMALSKDLLILDAVLALEPDLILWSVTLESFPRQQQLVPPLVKNNRQRFLLLAQRYNLGVDPQDERLIERNLWQRTIVGQRRPIADLLRLQLYGFSWAATGIDQFYPPEIELRTSDFEADLSWQQFSGPAELLSGELSPGDLAFDMLDAGVLHVGDIPLLIVNEPIYISKGENSDLRYNAWYPRWAYDRYRELLSQMALQKHWSYLDLWDSISAAEFTDSPVHLTPAGTARLSRLLEEEIVALAR